MYVTKSIGLACSYEAKKPCVTVPFLLCFTLYLRAISKYKPVFCVSSCGGSLYMVGPIFGILQ